MAAPTKTAYDAAMAAPMTGVSDRQIAAGRTARDNALREIAAIANRPGTSPELYAKYVSSMQAAAKVTEAGWWLDRRSDLARTARDLLALA